MTLLSNTGIAGLLAFAVFLFEVLRSPGGLDQRSNLKSLRWLVIGLLLVHLMVNPNLSSIILWIGFGLIIGTRCHQQRPIPALCESYGGRRRGVAA
jgi:hypothetical protein